MNYTVVYNLIDYDIFLLFKERMLLLSQQLYIHFLYIFPFLTVPPPDPTPLPKIVNCMLEVIFLFVIFFIYLFFFFIF